MIVIYCGILTGENVEVLPTHVDRLHTSLNRQAFKVLEQLDTR